MSLRPTVAIALVTGLSACGLPATQATGGSFHAEFSEPAGTSATTTAFDAQGVNGNTASGRTTFAGVFIDLGGTRTFTVTLRDAPATKTYTIVGPKKFEAEPSSDEAWIVYAEGPATGGASKGWRSTTGSLELTTVGDGVTFTFTAAFEPGDDSPEASTGTFTVTANGGIDTIR